MKPIQAFMKAKKVEQDLLDAQLSGGGVPPVTNPIAGHIPKLNADGTLVDSGVPIDTIGNASKIQSIPVDTTGIADGHVLTYVAAQGKFIPKPKPAGGGGFGKGGAGMGGRYLLFALYSTTILKV